MDKLLERVRAASSIDALIDIVASLHKPRAVAVFGVEKKDGVSLQRTRRAANDAAIALLNTLPADFDGNKLTQEQRQVLAGYTGEGGLKGAEGSQYEYYTPQFMAEGIWDLFSTYGVDSGHILEPSAGTGIFQETKKQGVLMTSAELSPLSGRINQLLHPEDHVNIGAFEALAVKPTQYDHAVGNVPFGEGRSGVAGLDPAYQSETNVGNYFVLRTIDKVNPGGLVVLVVPNGMTDGAKSKKLREKVSRRAEFLGAHRMPSGTFSESGTDTVVDVWVLRKHTEELADAILENKDTTLKAANVLWPTFINGKWFTTAEGRKFVHGEAERTAYQNRLVVKKDGRVSNATMKTALSRRFDSRIDYDLLSLDGAVAWQGAKEGDKRLVGGVWYEYDGVSWVQDTTTDHSRIDSSRYGLSTFAELRAALQSPQGVLSLSWDQIQAAAKDYPSILDESTAALVRFAQKQKAGERERIFRGAMIGQLINMGLDRRNQGDDADAVFADAARLSAAEVTRYGPPGAVKLVDMTEASAKAWLTFAGNVTQDGGQSDLLSGTLDTTEGAAGIDFTNPEQVVTHLFSDVALMPVTLEQLREVFKGQLPDDDDAALNYLAQFPGIAVDGWGGLLPVSRATSGNITTKVNSLLEWLKTATGERKANFERQLALIEERRQKTSLNDITVNLNARWIDRRLIKDFLESQGYEDFRYTSPDLQVENGILVSPDDYEGKDGVFTGYQLRTVVGRNGAEFKKSNNKEGFLNQLENYLNGVKPRGPNANEYLDKIAGLESSFNDWLRTHARAGEIERQYNDAFNGYIPFAHSSAPLGLEGISGERVPLSYQNEEVRRLSEDGRGIMGFGTGLGKTTTALALEAYNFETGRTKRTCIVVPKAVYQNWYHEAQGFYSKDAFASMMFVGLDEVRGEDGSLSTAPVLDKDGNARTDSTGQPLTRNVVKESPGATVIQRMNMIPSSNWRTVIMTKEQFASIPLREDTIEENSRQAVFNAAELGRLDLASGKHRDAQKKNRIKDLAADTGSVKRENVPYFEDMNFDSVIADEGHNYRNAYNAGREAGQLAYLPSSSVSKMARDMAVKASLMMRKNNGRGVVMLTATPLVNSPIDAFNMLSTVVPQEEWLRMGITTPDDFVRVFGKTATVTVQKISGELVEKQGLVGFKNLDGLRGIFHRWTTMKSAEDVGATVKIPDIIENSVEIPMTEVQETIYEELRKRAEELSSETQPITVQNADGTTSQMMSIKAPGSKPDDFIFSIIRDMDKVAIDPDLYAGAITFRFPKAHTDAVKAIAAALPAQAGGKVVEDEDETDDESGLVNTRASRVVDTEVIQQGDVVELRASITLEAQILTAIAKASINMKQVSHPIPPKYAALVDNLREGLKHGKQIIFIDEKAQHQKLKRIIAGALEMDESEIGVINATTVSQNSGVKLKAVKEPSEPKPGANGEYKEGAWEAYYDKRARYDDYVSAKNDAGLEGMEGIAADYNEGRCRIIICNKKAEVGINLHIGTTDIHHLTLPWTPASIDQRNGRGARVGSPQERVNVHYYCGRGTFDDFRLATLKRKKDWIRMVMASDLNEVENGDADDANDRAAMLAENPQARQAMIERQLAERERARQEKAVRDANVALDTLLKSASAASRDEEMLILEERSAQEQVTRLEAQLDEQIGRGTNMNGQKYTRNSLSKAKKSLRAARGTLARYRSAAVMMKRARGDVERAISAGVLDIERDVLESPELYMRTPGNVILKKGRYYSAYIGMSGTVAGIVRVIAVDGERESARCVMAWGNDFGLLPAMGRQLDVDFKRFIESVSYEPSLAAALELAAQGVQANTLSNTLSRAHFTDAIREGVLQVKERDDRSYSSINGWPYRDAGGEVVIAQISGGRIKSDSVQVTQWIYPDRQDEALKREFAKRWYQGDEQYRSSLEGFVMGLFGNNFEKAMEPYGEQATLDDVKTLFAQLTDAADKTDRPFAGVSEQDLRAMFRDMTGQRITAYWESLFGIRRFRPLMAQYSNSREIDDMYVAVRGAAIAEKEDRSRRALVAWRDAMYTRYTSLTDAEGWAGLESTAYQEVTGAQYTVEDCNNPMETDAALWIKVGTLIGAYEAKYVTISDFSDAVAIKRLVGMSVTRAKALKRGDYRSLLPEDMQEATWEEFVSWKNGGLDEAALKAILTKNVIKQPVEAEAATEKAQSIADEDYTIKVNGHQIKGKARVRGRWWSVSEEAGAVYLIADNPGSSTIRQAKDAIKGLGGKFWNFEANPIADIDMDRPAWMVSTRYSLDEVQSVIANAR